MVGVLGQDGRPCGRIQLFPVDAEAGQVWPNQDASQGRGTPAAASYRRDAPRVQLPAQRGEGLPSKGPAGQVLDDGGLVRLDGAEVHWVTVASWAAVGPAPFGQFLLLAADPP